MVAKAKNVERLVGKTIVIAGLDIGRGKNDINAVVVAFLHILFHDENASVCIGLQISAHSTVAAVGTYQIVASDSFARLEDGDNLSVGLFFYLKERPLPKCAPQGNILLQQGMVEHFALDNADGFLNAELTGDLVIHRKADVFDGVVVVLKTWHQLIKQMPGSWGQSTPTYFVTREGGLIYQQAIHPCFLEQIGTD